MKSLDATIGKSHVLEFIEEVLHEHGGRISDIYLEYKPGNRNRYKLWKMRIHVPEKAATELKNRYHEIEEPPKPIQLNTGRFVKFSETFGAKLTIGNVDNDE